MAGLAKNYNKIISELEEKITNPQELEFVKSKFSELAVMFMDTVETLVTNSEKQLQIERKVESIQKSLKRIENDIYIEDDDCECDEDCNGECDCGGDCSCGDQMHDNDYEFEIVCPYCNYEFVTGKEANLKDEIKCPKCHNVIELDWDDYCDGECNHCSEHCYSEEEDMQESKINEEGSNEYKYTKSDEKKNKEAKSNENNNPKQDNEDDM